MRGRKTSVSSERGRRLPPGAFAEYVEVKALGGGVEAVPGRRPCDGARIGAREHGELRPLDVVAASAACLRRRRVTGRRSRTWSGPRTRSSATPARTPCGCRRGGRSRPIVSRSSVAPNSLSSGTSPVTAVCWSALLNARSSSGSQLGPEPGPPSEPGRQYTWNDMPLAASPSSGSCVAAPKLKVTRGS